MKRVGLLMGCFNPIHNSHIALAENILKEGLVDEVEVIPAKDNLNIKDVVITKAEDRLNMINLALAGKKSIKVNTVEIDSDRQLYTYETLKKVKEDRELYLILGSDNLKNLDNWRNPEEILSNYKIIVTPRDSDNVEEIIENNRLKCVELQLPRFRGHGNGNVVADDVEGDLVNHFGDYRVYFSGHY